MRGWVATSQLARSFFERPTLTVARELLGQKLVRCAGGERLAGLICETEAYGGPDDEASHAYRRTRRSEIMYGPPGHAYVYFIYGMHHCLNATTEADTHPGAVLIRAVVPIEGLAAMRARRPGIPDSGLTDGPGKLCQAMAITLAQNGLDLTSSDELFIESGRALAPHEVIETPRIGVRGGDETRNRPWRFVWQVSRHVVL